MFNFLRRKNQPTVPEKSSADVADKNASLHISCQSAQSLGKLREHMEDASFCLQMDVRASESHYKIGLFMVADGMGGHLNGEVASNLAIQIISGCLLKSIVEPLRLGQERFSEEEAFEALNEAVNSAQKAILAQVPGGGTTLSLALIVQNELFFAHAGDSRLYLKCKGQPAEQLTIDHSLVTRLIELGQITPKEALHHPQRNVLYKALGQEEGFKVDLGHRTLSENSSLLLCSDGLWSLIGEETLQKALAKGPRPGLAEELCELANQAGGNDNISVILVTIK